MNVTQEEDFRNRFLTDVELIFNFKKTYYEKDS